MPPPHPVKVVLVFLDKVLPRFKVVRGRPSMEDSQGHSSQTVTHHESFIPPGPEVSTTEPYYRQASDMAQVCLPVVQAALAGPIPIAGAPIQAAIGGLSICWQFFKLQ
ncbi:hypothetical protein M405DRAFT_847261 [Rhizopogon salebrosus TDB-379]|nr:hypothetical protein M405DRAFT_847261 [Rhizopogon salebrosus TDB-379]